jgi:hypothetical protein
MKKLSFAFIILLVVGTIGCKSQEEKEAELNDLFSEILEDTGNSLEETVSPRCKDISIEDFDKFLGIKNTNKEKDLTEIMGKSSGGEYTAEKDRFKYYYKETKRVPVTIYVNAESGAIETIFMEILGLNENFDQDVMKADEDFNIDECQLSLFGQTPKEILALFGQADKDNIGDNSVEEDVRTLVYYSEDESIAITLKFYKSQDNMMSSLMVDWM